MLTIDDPELERRIHEEVVRTGRPAVEVLRRALGVPCDTEEDPDTLALPPEERPLRRELLRQTRERIARLAGKPVAEDSPLFPVREGARPVTPELVKRMLGEVE
jgi:hypothetical protein